MNNPTSQPENDKVLKRLLWIFMLMGLLLCWVLIKYPHSGPQVIPWLMGLILKGH